MADQRNQTDVRKRLHRYLDVWLDRLGADAPFTNEAALKFLYVNDGAGSDFEEDGETPCPRVTVLETTSKVV